MLNNSFKNFSSLQKLLKLANAFDIQIFNSNIKFSVHEFYFLFLFSILARSNDLTCVSSLSRKNSLCQKNAHDVVFLYIKFYDRLSYCFLSSCMMSLLNCRRHIFLGVLLIIMMR